MENVGLLAAFVPPFDATLCSGFAPSRARPSWMLWGDDVFDWAEWRCCCDAGFLWRLDPVRVKPLLSAFMDAPASCDAGRGGD